MDGKPIEILLVEDNDADAELALHALRKSQLANHIHRARDGEEALDFIFCRGQYSTRSFEDVPQLILLDLKLPKVDGLQVLQQVKAEPRTRAIPVIILTSSNEERDVAKSYLTGVNSYIQKPVSFSEFQNIVRQLGMYWLLLNAKPPISAFNSQ
jgi:two-component system, response regulator